MHRQQTYEAHVVDQGVDTLEAVANKQNNQILILVSKVRSTTRISMSKQ